MERVEREELVEVVDEQNDVVGIVTRSVMRRDNLRHRGVSILVRDPLGRVLVHRRADTKDVWPGLWDLTAGGVVGVGESFEIAARRELAEELGVTGAALEPLGVGRFDDAAVRVIAGVFTTVHDGPVSFPDGEVAEAHWVTTHELSRMLATMAFVPDALALLSDFLPEVFAGGPDAEHS